tara:strand:- start:1315 stop:1533 length:219 start_codon:yes stop_codon:yes gene_type:complete
VTNSQCNDNHAQSQYGDGISHPKRGVKTKRFKLLVRNQEAAPMIWRTSAESQRAAIKYGKARWPEAAIEVIK